jgi:hypothetical protein
MSVDISVSAAAPQIAGSGFELFYSNELEKHNFILFTGVTKVGTPAGVWCSYIPPKDGQPGVIDMLYATRESRAFIADLLGLVGLHSMGNYGELPVGSHNLSCHSFPIQQRLAHILGQLPATAPVNSETWFNSINYLSQWHQARIAGELFALPLEDSIAGREYTLEILRGENVNGELPSNLESKAKNFVKDRRVNGLKLENYEKNYEYSQIQLHNVGVA